MNAELSQSQLQQVARPTAAARALLEQVFERLGLSGPAPTIARCAWRSHSPISLADRDDIGPEQIAEAVQLRRAAADF